MSRCPSAGSPVFNPQHGPARTDIDWKPPGGVERSIGVCLPDALRLEGGERPDMRLVRVGDRWVPWYAASNETIASQRLQRFSDLPLEAQLYATANGIGRDLGSGLPF